VHKRVSVANHGPRKQRREPTQSWRCLGGGILKGAEADGQPRECRRLPWISASQVLEQVDVLTPVVGETADTASDK
jgi:hypothetical protein